MVKLGLVIGSLIFKPAARPRVKVVLPEPTSPISSMIWFVWPFFRRFLAILVP